MTFKHTNIHMCTQILEHNEEDSVIIFVGFKNIALKFIYNVIFCLSSMSLNNEDI